jgi:hypothetical protein
MKWAYAPSICLTDPDGEWYSSIKTFRRGARTVGKWTGYEVLTRKHAQELEQESHEFVFLSQGEPKNPMLPVLEIEMHSGVLGNTAWVFSPL